MKHKILLTEEELVYLIDNLVESSSLHQYDEEDFYDVFIQVFKPWIKNKLGEDILSKTPLSKLVKNYFADFIDEFGLEESHSYWNLHRKIVEIGRELVKSEKMKLPSLQPTELFTQKYGKILKFLVDNMKLPSWIDISFTEDSPYHVKMKVKSNWPEMIKSDEKQRPIRDQKIFDEIGKVLQEYVGIEISGKPIYGELDFDLMGSELINVEEWVKKVLNKEIKLKLKQSEVGKYIHSVSFKPNSSRGQGDFKITLKSFGSNQRYKIKEKLKEILKEMGYNTNFFDIDI